MQMSEGDVVETVERSQRHPRGTADGQLTFAVALLATGDECVRDNHASTSARFQVIPAPPNSGGQNLGVGTQAADRLSSSGSR